MKKRWICLLLSVLMVAFCFAGCSEKDRDEVMKAIGEKSSKGAVTLSMYLVSEQPVSAEQEKLMEDAVNAITEKEFKVRMDLRYFTPDEYYAKLESDLAKTKQYYEGEGIGKKKETPVYIDENGLPQIWYPSIEDFAVDIFYFGGYDKYTAYKSAGYLRDISTEVDGTAKALKSVVNSNLLQQVKALNGTFDMIPVNRTIGEYTYLLLNKEVLKATKYSASDITSLVDEDCADLLELVSQIFGDEYVPLKSYTDEIDLIGVKYFGVDQNGFMSNDFSIIAGTYDSNWVYGAPGAYPEMSDILNTKDNGKLTAEEQLRILKGYEFAGYYGTEDTKDKPFAVGYIKGGPEIVAEYGDDYEVIPVAFPTLKTEDVYEHCFAITEKTNSAIHSAEILNYLNTNEAFRNLILYGIENVNYVWTNAIGDDGNPIIDANGNVYKVIRRITDNPETTYVLDENKTGNTVIAYVPEGENPLSREYTLEQNHDIRLDYTIGFKLYDATFSNKTKVDLTAIKTVSLASKTIEEKIKATATPEAFEDAIKELRELITSDVVTAVLDMPGYLVADAPETPDSGEDGDGAGSEEIPADTKVYTTVAAYYDEWLKLKNLKVTETAT